MQYVLAVILWTECRHVSQDVGLIAKHPTASQSICQCHLVALSLESVFHIIKLGMGLKPG